MVEDVGFEPRLCASAAAALIDECIVCDAERPRCKAAHFFELFHVIGGVGHRHGNAVRDIHDLNVWQRVRGKLGQSFPQTIFGCFKESGVIEEYAGLVDPRRALTDFRLRTSDVLAVLASSRVRAVGGSHKGERAGDAVPLHLP